MSLGATGTRWLRTAGIVAVLVVPTVIIFAPCLTASFVYDDHPYVVENPLVTDDSIPVTEIFLQPFPNRAASRDWYRPLTVLSYRLNTLARGLSAPAFHAANLVLHLIAVALVFVWCRRWLASDTSAGVAALYFALKPGHAEAVLWVTGRSELLAACLCLAGLIVVARRRKPENAPRTSEMIRIATLAVLFLAALLAKESAVLLLPMVLATVVGSEPAGVRSRDGWHRALVLLVPLLLVLAGFLVLRHGVVGRLMPGADELPGLSVWQRLPVSGRVWWQAVVSVLSLSQPTVEYHWVAPLSWTWQAVAGWLMVAFAVVCWFVATRTAVRHGIAVTLIGLALYSHLLASPELFAERFLYLPSAGICLLVGLVHELLHRRLRSVTVTLLAVVCCLAAGWQTYSYAKVWQDDVSLWQYTCRVVPQSPVAWNNLGTGLHEAQQPRPAINAFARALGDPNEDRRARLGMLRALGRLGDFRAGLALAEESLQRYPEDPEILYLLGRHQLAGGDHDAARQTITRLRASGNGEAREYTARLEEELAAAGTSRSGPS